MMDKTLTNFEFFSLVEEELADCGRARIRVKGVSMQPLLRDGVDEVVLRKLSDDEAVVKGEIYLFKVSGRHILHRCIASKGGNARAKRGTKLSEKKGDMLVFRGDNAYSCEQCSRSAVLAVVEAVYRKKGSGFQLANAKSPYWAASRIKKRIVFVLKRIYHNVVT